MACTRFSRPNTLTNAYYPTLAKILFTTAVELHRETGAKIAFINLSGGVGIPYRPDEPANDIAAIGEGVRKAFEEVLVPAGMGDVAIFTELGRFILGPNGALVTTACHEKHTYKEYIGVDAVRLQSDASGDVWRVSPHHGAGQRKCALRPCVRCGRQPVREQR